MTPQTIEQKQLIISKLREMLEGITPFKAACLYFDGKVSLDEYLNAMGFFDRIKELESEIEELRKS